MLTQRYGQGKDPTMVHRDVAELIKHVNALEKMTLNIHIGSVVITGKLEFTESGCVLHAQSTSLGN